MKKLFFGFLFMFLLLPIFSVVSAKGNLKSNELVVLEKGKTVNSDYFITGEKVIVSGTVNGDVYAAGGDVVVDGTVNGDLLAAGGNITVAGIVSGNIRAAGGNLNINGTVDKNITVAGGMINISENAKVAGSIVAAGGSINLYSPIGKGATFAGGQVTVFNKVGGGITAAVGELSLGSKASINGDLVYVSDKELARADGSTVSGKIIHNLPPELPKETAQNVVRGISFGFTLFSLLTAFLVGSLLLYLFPKFTQKVSDRIVKNTMSVFLTGILFLITVPFICLLLLFTVIGIPLSIILLVSYIFLLCFAHIFSAITLGKWTLEKLSFSSNSYMALAVGLIVLYILRLIPIVGWTISFVALVFGLGAYIIVKKELFTQLRNKKAL